MNFHELNINGTVYYLTLDQIKTFIAGKRPRPKLIVYHEMGRRVVKSIGNDWVRIYVHNKLKRIPVRDYKFELLYGSCNESKILKFTNWQTTKENTDGNNETYKTK